MRYPIQIPGFEGQKIEVEPKGLFFNAKLTINGELAPEGERHNEIILTRNDGEQVIARWKHNFLGLDIPKLVVEQKLIPVVEPLRWYEWVWSGLPLLLIIHGGALGVVIGWIIFSMNIKVFRSDKSTLAKYLLTGGFSITSLFLYLALALLLYGLGA